MADIQHTVLEKLWREFREYTESIAELEEIVARNRRRFYLAFMGNGTRKILSLKFKPTQEFLNSCSSPVNQIVGPFWTLKRAELAGELASDIQQAEFLALMR